MPIEQLIFYLFSGILILSAGFMICVKNPVISALFLVLCFIASAGLWLLLEAEFLALVLVFVYVGAVMTLFLFVVMMLNLDTEKLRTGFVRYLPFGVLAVAVMMGLMIKVLAPLHLGSFAEPARSADYSNIKQLGVLLYTEYAYPFELAAVILLVAIIAAISLTHIGKSHCKSQNINRQVRVQRKDRVRLIKMVSEKPVSGEGENA